MRRITKPVQIGVRLDNKLKYKLELKAMNKHMSLSEYVREILRREATRP